MSKISNVEIYPTAIAMKDVFTIGTGFVGDSDSAGDHIFVKITTDDGYSGWGEQRALPTWSYETTESISSTIRFHIAPLLLGKNPLNLNEIRSLIDHALKPAVSNGHPFAKAAVDIALYDLCGKILNVPIHSIFGGKQHNEIPLSYALSIDTPEIMALKAKALFPCSCYKVKVAGNPIEDEDRILAIHEAVPQAKLWIDANQSYTPSNALELLKRVKDIREIYCIEQPVSSQDWFGMKRVRESAAIPIAIDEGCFSYYDLGKIARLECADAVVLKICKSGGLLDCLKSVYVAEANALELLGSGLTEAGVGFIASVHLFSTIDLVLPAELNAPVFLDALAIDGAEIVDHVVTVPDGPGLGISVNEDYIKEHPLTSNSLK
ncbi:MAG: muconate cycloisomerase [Candidatus Poribacteria bacterium]|nr:muconate cycloisomerase [Candidatus Poribacteria bacterium]